MPHHHHHRGGGDEAPSLGHRLLRLPPLRVVRARGAGGYRRLDSAPALTDAAVRVEVGATKRERSVFHVDPAMLDAGPVRRLVPVAGRRLAGGGVAVAVDALLFEHLLWLATTAAGDGVDGAGDGSAGCCDDLSEIVEFYSHDDEEEEGDHHRFKC